MDINTLISRMQDDLLTVARNPLAQFGTPARPLVGATLLPEQTQEDNQYTEEQIRYKTIIANDGSRYSPVQLKQGGYMGSMDVKLADQDIGNIFTAREYEGLLRLLRSNASMDATVSLLRWADTTLNRALVQKIERMRWQAIVEAVVHLVGDNEYKEDVAYSNPAGHRVAAANAWSDNTYDPFDDIYAGASVLAAKGYKVGRFFTSARVVAILCKNAKVKERAGRVTIANGGLTAVGGRVQLAELNGMLAADGLPQIEINDETFRTMTGTARYMPNDVFVMIATTGQDLELDLGDTIQPVQNVLGYVGIGKATGQAAPGRIINMFPKADRPIRIEGEAYQTSLPVILEPEAIFVIRAIA